MIKLPQINLKKNGIIFTALFSLLFTGYIIDAQEKWQKEGVRIDPPVCFASEESGHSYVMPPAGFLNRLKSGKKTSDIRVSFVSFPDSVKPALEYAAGIWEYVISSSVPIYLEARWQVLTSTTLGSCGPSNYYINFRGAPIANTYYPVAVVEKILEEEKTGQGSPDMIARFNSSIAWYTGTDGKTPSNKYDLVSTALHEIGHGLGITGFFYVRTSNSAGYYGNDDNFPSVFDRQVEDFNSKRLTDENVYKNGTNGLYQALVSNQLYSGSPVAYAWYFQNRPRLYAPATYKDGSSIYHLNDATYTYGTENALMTSSAGKGEAVHSPGPLTSGILADLGWKYMYLRYSPMKDAEELTTPLNFDMAVVSELGLNRNSLYLVYSKDGFKTKGDSVKFGQLTEVDKFRASLSPEKAKGTISYFMVARDSVGRKFTLPAQAPDSIFKITIGPDSVKPVISHSPRSFYLSSSGEIDISATVTDNTGVDTVIISFQSATGETLASGLVRETNDQFTGKFRISDLGLKGGDSVRYSISAIDVSKKRNVTNWPAKGTFPVLIERIGKPVITYETDFNSEINDFILADFNIGKEKNFDNATLNSRHPYLSPDKDNTALEFSTVFRYPVIISGNASMNFDEVVLVEPGETGAVFGSEDFFDYVIVEGSRDAGKSWSPFLDGYDSGSQASWKSAYEKNIVGNNSTTIGGKDLFVKREFLLTGNGNFRNGDTVLIRFRLHSDPYAHGWGWAIDNLKIQTGTSASPAVPVSPGEVMVWPNPVTDRLHISVDPKETTGNLDIMVSDMTGRKIFSAKYREVVRGFSTDISFDKAPPGIYLVILRSNGISIQSKKVVKH